MQLLQGRLKDRQPGRGSSFQAPDLAFPSQGPFLGIYEEDFYPNGGPNGYLMNKWTRMLWGSGTSLGSHAGKV